VAATDLPVNADFESGFAPTPAGVAESVRLAVDTGVAGLSIEDSTGDAARPLFTLDEAVERLRAARRAIDQAGGDTLLVGRAECFLVGRPTWTRPSRGCRPMPTPAPTACMHPASARREQIRRVVAAVAPKPVNLLVGTPAS
jgi:2-methylisocitrate lyase-like PEP mutase family enzyme